MDAHVLANDLRRFANEIDAPHVILPAGLEDHIAALVSTPLWAPPHEMMDIVYIVSTVMRVSLPRLLAKNRTQRIAYVRQVAMYLCRTLTDSSFLVIGDHFGRDHSTVIHACNLIARRIREQEPYRLEIDRLSHVVKEQIDAHRSAREAA